MYSQLSLVETLDSTHGGTTTIELMKQNGQLCVCKSIKKASMVDEKSIEHVMNEKSALKHFSSVEQKGINRIITTFQDSDKLYLLLQPAKGLPLHKLLQMTKVLHPDFSFLLSVQIALILSSMHAQHYIYRDIKASNFMVDSKGRVTLIDLGHAKFLGESNKTYTICGTTHSMPLQVYTKEGYSYQFDYYGFGILLYEMLIGRAPFGYGNSNPNILEDMKIGLTEAHLALLPSQASRSLISSLLAPAPIRLGQKNGFNEILQHDYFNREDFMLGKDLYDGTEQINKEDQRFKIYLSDIQDFGIDEAKYTQINSDDPFYKFFG